MRKKNEEEIAFSPYDILENLKKNDLDPSIFETIDERDFLKAPNFLEFAVGPKFLNTLILPKQVEIGTKLFCEYCPRCSRPNYIDLLFDQSVGNIKDNIVFLEHGICPKCKVTRFELVKSKELIFRNELVGVAGQRCIPKNSLVFTKEGIKIFSDVIINDTLSHGNITKIFDSGMLPSLKLTTKYNYTLIGAKDSHIVPVLRTRNNNIKYNHRTKWEADFYIEDTLIKNCKVGDILLLHMSNLWPTQQFSLPKYEYIPNKYCSKYNIINFPNKVTPELARIIGYLIAKGSFNVRTFFKVSFNKKNTYCINDFIRCCIAVFNKAPKIEKQKRNCIDVTICSVPIIEWLEQSVGLQRTTAHYKIVPNAIMRSPKNIVCEFLSALFECDGSIYLDKKNYLKINYSSVSETLIKQVRLLLLNLGIITSKRQNVINGYKKTNSSTLHILNSSISKCTHDKNLRYHVPIDCDFQLQSYDKWPISLKKLYEQNYYPVPIKFIEDGPDLEMMDVSIPDTNLYTADGFVHHNSGKTKLVGLIATYINHRFLKIPNPIRTFNQTSGDMLSGTFSALSLEHSYKNLWQAFKGFIDGSPWFQNYHKFIKEEGKRLGIELFHELKASMFYGHKHLMWGATGSQDRKMRGDTRIFAAIDELGWMISDEQKTDLQNMNADAIYTALSNSLTTMRTKYNQVYTSTNFDIPPILMSNISSPSSVKDKIMRLLKDAKKNDRIYAFHYATWEMNCDYTYESLREDQAHIDELTFQRDYAGEPPLAANPYISEPRLIDKIATGELYTGILANHYYEEDTFGDTYKSVKLIPQKPDKLTPRLVSFDLGSFKNSLAICIFSLNHDLRPKLDLAIVVKPDAKSRTRANIAKIFDDFTAPLCTAFNIRHVFFDRWQSLDQVERLKGMGVQAEIYSLSYKEMDSLRGAIISQSIIIPKLQKTMEQFVKEYVDDIQHADPLALLGLQLLTVRDLGHKMAKPLMGDDDLFRAFALGATKLLDPKTKAEYLKGAMQTKTGHTVSFLGTVRVRSAGGGGLGVTGTIEGENGKQLGLLRSRRGNR